MGHVAPLASLAYSEPVDTLDQTARRLGYAGLLLPALTLSTMAIDPSLRWFVVVAGFGYTAFIFSFLGGIWWGLAMTRRAVPAWLWFAAVAPSLISLALFLPWAFGWEWPGPEMQILAALVLVSPLVDLAIARSRPLPMGWIRLRFQLSAGLSLLTIIIARL